MGLGYGTAVNIYIYLYYFNRVRGELVKDVKNREELAEGRTASGGLGEGRERWRNSQKENGRRLKRRTLALIKGGQPRHQPYNSLARTAVTVELRFILDLDRESSFLPSFSAIVFILLMSN